MLYHIVLFEFKPEVSKEQVQDVIDRFLALKTKCLRANTNEGYIKSSVGGKDISIENIQYGISHAFIAEFEHKEDRDYYVNQDPAHREYVQWAMQYLAKAQVLDFIPGDF